MSDPTKDRERAPTLDQVIEGYLLRREEAIDGAADEAFAARAKSEVLGEFMRRFPQFADELMEYAATASITESSPARATDADEERLVRSGMETVARVLAARRDQTTAKAGSATHAASFATLRREAEGRGLTLATLAARLDLSVPVVAKLDRRLIRFASIPNELIARLAAALEGTEAAVADYLRGGARFATGAAFLADEAPRMPDQQDFSEAIETDLTMSDEQKRAWRVSRDD